MATTNTKKWTNACRELGHGVGQVLKRDEAIAPRFCPERSLTRARLFGSA